MTFQLTKMVEKFLQSKLTDTAARNFIFVDELKYNIFSRKIARKFLLYFMWFFFCFFF